MLTDKIEILPLTWKKYYSTGFQHSFKKLVIVDQRGEKKEGGWTLGYKENYIL